MDRQAPAYSPRLFFLALIAAGLACLLFVCSSCDGSGDSLPSRAAWRVLLITAHPDDETMFNLGRFRERGWRTSIALVTNGENGGVVQGIKPDYDPQKDDDVLIENDPGPGVWLTVPPDGPRLKEITTKLDLAIQRRGEFLDSSAIHGVLTVYFLSGLGRFDFEDSWDNGVANWDQGLLAARLMEAAALSRPDIIITLDPDETWAHRQHYGLARIVKSLWENGAFDAPGGPRPLLYGIREHGWYERSWEPLEGDERFDRDEYSPALAMTYEDYWARATGAYISQSSHPVWFGARVGVKILPGYRGVDIIRRLDALAGREGLSELFLRRPPDAASAVPPTSTPLVVDLSGE
ncbi:MAG: PIG-L family deacetylase [Pseudomonadota bacterium]